MLPWLLNKLKARKECLLQQKRDQNKIWRDVCEKNFYNSLDHRAFYFKQSEKKSTNTKSNIQNFIMFKIAFVLEIKARYEIKHFPTTPILVKKGGTQTSLYFNSFPAIKPESFHNAIISGDTIAAMQDE